MKTNHQLNTNIECDDNRMNYIYYGSLLGFLLLHVLSTIFLLVICCPHWKMSKSTSSVFHALLLVCLSLLILVMQMPLLLVLVVKDASMVVVPFQ